MSEEEQVLREDITEDEFLPQCCDNMSIEMFLEDDMMISRCTNCGSGRPDLDG